MARSRRSGDSETSGVRRSATGPPHVVTETSGGRYVCAGWQARDLNTDSGNISFAAGDGTFLWQDVTRTVLHNLHEKILQHPDGSYAIAGSAARPGRSFRIQRIKADPEGDTAQ
jgi:hypothetical protein